MNMHILLVNGPNLNILGSRDADHYGTITLEEIEKTFTKRASDLNVDLEHAINIVLLLYF